MLIKIGSVFVDPTEIAAIIPDHDDSLSAGEQHRQICIELRHGGGFWIEATMDEAEAALIDAGVIEEPTTDELPELSVSEILLAKKLYADGYIWLARDKDGKLYAYREKPYYDGAYWNANASSIPTIALVDNGFDFIATDDEEPWDIETLMRIDF